MRKYYFFHEKDWCDREEEGKGSLNPSSILHSDKKWQNAFFYKKDWCDREEEGKEESFFEIVYLTNPLGLH